MFRRLTQLPWPSITLICRSVCLVASPHGVRNKLGSRCDWIADPACAFMKAMANSEFEALMTETLRAQTPTLRILSLHMLLCASHALLQKDMCPARTPVMMPYMPTPGELSLTQHHQLHCQLSHASCIMRAPLQATSLSTLSHSLLAAWPAVENMG